MVSLCADLAGPERTDSNCPDGVSPKTSRKHRRLTFVLAAAFSMTQAHSNPAPEEGSWPESQAKIHTWKADFVQTRSFKSLTHPLTAPGHIWFKEPNLFRWELGKPPRTIAVRTPKELLLIYPLPKREERYPLTADKTGQWRDALALLETGFPRSRAEVDARFQTVSEAVTNGMLEVVLEPKSSEARRFIPRFKLEFATNGFSLRASQLFFPDGSYLRNDFTNAVLNPEIDEAVFNPTTPPDFIVTEPMSPKGRHTSQKP